MKQAAADRASLDEMKKAIGDQLAATYEQAMSKYPLGRYRDRVGQNVSLTYQKGLSILWGSVAGYPAGCACCLRSHGSIGRYRDRVGQNVEMVYKKVVKKA